MAFDAQGNWKPEDDSVTRRLSGLMKQGSPIMQQAQTAGLKMANRRGLLNSSMAVGAAQNEAYKAALPSASQEAQQIAQKNLQFMSNQSQQQIAGMNVAAHDREKAMAAVAEMQKNYDAMFSDLQKNNDIPAETRNKYLQHIAALRDSDLNLVEQIYNIDLEWASPSISV